ncbi:hypothetical protein KAR48_00630, partial [bacterium]|nr:hypothetical protein [bacterium]
LFYCSTVLLPAKRSPIKTFGDDILVGAMSGRWWCTPFPPMSSPIQNRDSASMLLAGNDGGGAYGRGPAKQNLRNL